MDPKKKKIMKLIYDLIKIRDVKIDTGIYFLSYFYIIFIISHDINLSVETWMLFS